MSVTTRSAVETAPRREDPALVRRWSIGEGTVCALGLLSLGSRVYLPSHVPLASLVVLASSPAWLWVLRRYRFASGYAMCTLLALAFGLGLTIFASGTHHVARTGLIGDLTLILLTFGGVGLVLWGRQRLGAGATGFLLAAGMLFGAVAHGAQDSGNLWKSSWAIPVTVLVLSLSRGSRWLSLFSLAVLGAISVFNDSRAHVAVLFVCIMLLLWQTRPSTPRRRTSYTWTTVMLACLGIVVYYLGSATLTEGLLGTDAQTRSLNQIATSGTLILGGRPEIAATLALILRQFWGYGFGVLPRSADVQIAKEGLARINYDPNNGYVDRYMFGSGFELHSVIGDVWVRMGPFGLVLLALVLLILVASLADGLASRTADALVLFAALWSCWNLLFSPLLSAALPLTLAIGMAMAPRRPQSQHQAQEAGSTPEQLETGPTQR